MKKKTPSDNMQAEYDLDYTQAKKNRFAGEQQTVSIILDPDIDCVFKTSESVNKALRALLEVIPPKTEKQKKSPLHP